ncbi:MAG: hypothetical protein ABI549_12765 [Flavobacterium sp.]|uniref:hypothetical protein n=1 Tax=Flavobacterium sp. TaxID=239 RepID=UPI0032657E3F
MKRKILLSIKILMIVILTSCSGKRSDPSGSYYGGPPLTPNVYLYTFNENGTVQVCQNGTVVSCCTENGTWSTDEKGNITISGLNSGCEFMKSLNGTYYVCDSPDCIPSGKGYLYNDIHIWPNKD